MLHFNCFQNGSENKSTFRGWKLLAHCCYTEKIITPHSRKSRPMKPVRFEEEDFFPQQKYLSYIENFLKKVALVDCILYFLLN